MSTASPSIPRPESLLSTDADRVGKSKLAVLSDADLVRIVANVSIARLRSGKRELPTIPLDDYGVSRERDDVAPERPDELLARSDTHRMIEAKIEALPDAYRLVFILRAVQKLSVEETSEALGIPQATVRSRFSRARGLLRKSLAARVDAFGDAFPFAGARCDRMVEVVMRQLSPALV